MARTATTVVFCPACQQPVEASVVIAHVSILRGNLRVVFNEAMPPHECPQEQPR